MAATIEDLSPELLVKIFSHYVKSEGHVLFQRNVMPVCRTWRNLSSIPLLWKRVKLPSWSYALSLCKKRGLLCHTQSIKLPDRCDNDPDYVEKVPLNPDRLLALLSNIHDLKSLKISNNTIDANLMMIVAKRCPNLEVFHLKKSCFGDYKSITLKELNPIITECGPKLKTLQFTHCLIYDGEQTILEIASKCPSLEVFRWRSSCKFPIYKLVRGCPKLQKLDLWGCKFSIIDGNNCLGFKDLTVFRADKCDICGFGVWSFLKHSKNLQHIEFELGSRSVLGEISEISSNKIRFLNISLKYEDRNLTALEDAVDKWKHTLLYLRIMGWQCDVTSVLKKLLNDNQCPKLKWLRIDQGYIDQSFLKVFIQKCQNLKVLEYEDSGLYFANREKVMKFCDSL